MIKINIEDPKTFEQDYCNKVLDSTKKRIEIFKITLEHLQGCAIDIDHLDLDAFKATTKNTINIIEDSNLKENPTFLKHNYEATLSNYLKNNNLQKVNMKGIYNLLNFLLENSTDELKKLLICKPEYLKSKNDFLLNNFNLKSKEEKEILKLAFSYEKYSSISDKIKEFFRINNHIKICPYCNLLDVKHRPTLSGHIGMLHELDHFFDKASYPLLSCSMYNLIPSDSTCNGSGNKGTTPFNDTYYLNPYISGFHNSISYRPVNVSINYEVEKIILEVNEPNSLKLQQLVGKAGKVDESTKEGNINVFRLETKYRDRNDEATNLLIKIKNNDRNVPSLEKFISLMGLKSSKNAYLKWYKIYIGTHFNEKEFGEKAFSKFNRDIHDYYFEKNKGKKKLMNRYIYELIDNSDI